MRKAWILLGRLLFWLTWPLLFIYLRCQPPRTRVIIAAGGKILLVKGWLGSGQWTLPGGGLHGGEDPALGAVREVKEETGLTIKPQQLRPLGQGVTGHAGLRYRFVSFVVNLSGQEELRRQRYELTDLTWVPLTEIGKSASVGRDARRILAAWRDHV